jgi:hypothetical protein
MLTLDIPKYDVSAKRVMDRVPTDERHAKSKAKTSRKSKTLDVDFMRDPTDFVYNRTYMDLPTNINVARFKSPPDDELHHSSKTVNDGYFDFKMHGLVHKDDTTIVKTYEMTPMGRATLQDAEAHLHRFVGNEVYWQEYTRLYLQSHQPDDIKVITPQVYSVYFGTRDDKAISQITMEWMDTTSKKVDPKVMYYIEDWLIKQNIHHNDIHGGNIKFVKDDHGNDMLVILDYGSTDSVSGPRVGGRRRKKRTKRTYRKKKNRPLPQLQKKLHFDL